MLASRQLHSHPGCGIRASRRQPMPATLPSTARPQAPQLAHRATASAVCDGIRLPICTRTSSWLHRWQRLCHTSRPGSRVQASPADNEPAPSSSLSSLEPVEVESVSLQPPALQSLGDTLPASEAQQKSDTSRAAAVAVVVSLLAIVTETNKGWIASHQDMVMAIVFIAGYLGIIVEEFLGLNKAGVALLMAAALWSVRADASPEVLQEMSESLSDVSGIIFFLIGAMTIVEVVDAHQGFKIITDSVKPRSQNSLLWIVGTITFFMSAVLDNLTTTIVMVSLLQKLCPDPETRRYLGGVVVIAANAGGAWTPIGDVTTTMLWVGGQIGTVSTMRDLLLPSLVCTVVPLAGISLFSNEFKGDMPARPPAPPGGEQGLALRGKLVLSLGLGALLTVPVFKAVTGLPPFMGMLAGLGFMWLFVDALHYGEDQRSLSVSSALKRIDSEGVLFFLGILMAVASLDASGALQELAQGVDALTPRQDLVALLIGAASAVVDNVPLVAACMGMYEVTQYPIDSQLWQMIAYASGTGGSMLIIGSAAGVAFMGMEQAKFGWYLKTITPWAVVGYASGFATYLALHL